jgi:alkylated DNA repair dioxygenase AlkB
MVRAGLCCLLLTAGGVGLAVAGRESLALTVGPGRPLTRPPGLRRFLPSALPTQSGATGTKRPLRPTVADLRSRALPRRWSAPATSLGLPPLVRTFLGALPLLLLLLLLAARLRTNPKTAGWVVLALDQPTAADTGAPASTPSPAPRRRTSKREESQPGKKADRTSWKPLLEDWDAGAAGPDPGGAPGAAPGGPRRFGEWAAAAAEAEELPADWRPRRAADSPIGALRREAQAMWRARHEEDEAPLPRITFRSTKELLERELDDLDDLKGGDDGAPRTLSMFMAPKEDEAAEKRRDRRWRGSAAAEEINEGDVYVDPNDLPKPPKPKRTRRQATEDLLGARTPEAVTDALVANAPVLSSPVKALGILRAAKMLVQPSARLLRADLIPDLDAVITDVDIDTLSQPQKAELLQAMALLYGGLARNAYSIVSSTQRDLQEDLEAEWEWLTPYHQYVTLWASDRLRMERRPKMERLYNFLPFRVHHSALGADAPTVEAVSREVVFTSGFVTLGNGRLVPERRDTAWQAACDPDLTFRYSGKVMRAVRAGFTPAVEQIARACERVAAADLYHRVHYDGVLLNRYEDGSSGMKYHADPDQGTLWAPSTCVASIGATRKLCFKALADPDERYEFFVFHGDVVHMFGDCNTGRFVHAIKTEAFDVRPTPGPRLSLVFKQSIPPWERPPPPDAPSPAAPA